MLRHHILHKKYVIKVTISIYLCLLFWLLFSAFKGGKVNILAILNIYIYYLNIIFLLKFEHLHLEKWIEEFGRECHFKVRSTWERRQGHTPWAKWETQGNNLPLYIYDGSLLKSYHWSQQHYIIHSNGSLLPNTIKCDEITHTQNK